MFTKKIRLALYKDHFVYTECIINISLQIDIYITHNIVKKALIVNKNTNHFIRIFYCLVLEIEILLEFNFKKTKNKRYRYCFFLSINAFLTLLNKKKKNR